MPPEIRAQLENHIPEEPSKEIRAYYKDMAKPEGSTPAKVQEYNFYVAQLKEGEEKISFIEWRKLFSGRLDTENLTPSQAMAAVRSVENEANNRRDDLNGDLAELSPTEAVKRVAKDRGWPMDDLYGLAVGQKSGAEPKAAPAAETRTGPEGQVYEKGADGLWRERK